MFEKLMPLFGLLGLNKVLTAYENPTKSKEIG
jgi:hypothetical protein